MQQRDETVDLLRGCAIIWVVLVHSLYWTSFIPPAWSVPRSYLLIEMPIIFFLAGAAAALARPRDPADHARDRFVRILVPYWGFAAIALALSMRAALQGGGTYPPSEWAKWFFPYLLPQTDIPYLTYHLWFIRAYLGVTLTIPALLALHSWLQPHGAQATGRAPAWWRLALLWLPVAALAGAVWVLDLARDTGHNPGELAPYIASYALWVYLGIAWARSRVAGASAAARAAEVARAAEAGAASTGAPSGSGSSDGMAGSDGKGISGHHPLRYAAAVGAVVLFAACGALVRWGHYSANMQDNKFPPNAAFMVLQGAYFCVYALLAAPIVAWLRRHPGASASRVGRAALRLVRVYSRNGYTIYLYHALGFVALDALVQTCGLSGYLQLHPAIGVLLYSSALVAMGVWLARCFGWLEDGAKAIAGSRWARAALAAAVVAGLAVYLQRLYADTGLGLSGYPAFARFNVLFGSDVPRVIGDLTQPLADHYRSKVHPLFVLALCARGANLSLALGSSAAAAIQMVSTAGALCSVLIFAYAWLSGCGVVGSAALAGLLGFSASQMMWASVPETFVFAEVTLLLAHLVGLVGAKAAAPDAQPLGPRLRRPWLGAALIVVPVTTVLTLGVTTTNVLQSLVISGVLVALLARGAGPRPVREPVHANRRPWLYAAAFALVALLLPLVAGMHLADKQKAQYPTTIQWYKAEAYNEEPRYTHWGNLLHPIATLGTVARDLGVFAMVAPRPDVVPIDEPAGGQSIVFNAYDAGKYSILDRLALYAWGALLCFGVWSGWVSARPQLAMLAGSVIVNAGIHSVYGTNEAFLYSGHALFLLIAIAALGVARARRMAWPWKLGVLMAVVAVAWQAALASGVLVASVNTLMSVM